MKSLFVEAEFKRLRQKALLLRNFGYKIRALKLLREVETMLKEVDGLK